VIAPSRFRIQRTTLWVLLGALVTSCVVFFVAKTSVEHSSDLLLKEDAAQGSLVLSGYLTQSQPGLTALESSVGPNGVDVRTWTAAAAATSQHVGTSGLALLRVSGNRLQVLGSVGTIRMGFGTVADAPIVAAIATGKTPYDLVANSSKGRWLIQVQAGTPLPAGFALDAEMALPTAPISLASLPGHPFANIEAALYAGRESPRNIVFATTSKLPLDGRRAVTLLPMGESEFSSGAASLNSKVGSVSAPGQLLIILRATTNLSGTASTAMPWVLLAGLLLAGTAVAVLFEISGRRRIAAVETARQLEERNVMLDSAVSEQRRTDARFAAMVRSSSDLTTVIAADGTILYQSPSSEPLLGYLPEALVGSNFADLVHEDDNHLWQLAFAYMVQDPEGERSAEWRLRTVQGQEVPVETRLTNLLHDPTVSGIVLNSRDVSERTRLEAELRHQAFHDSLTGLANRALFQDRLQHAAHRMARTGGAISVLFLDLDDFKAVNDGRGHGAGDELLKSVGERLQETIRTGDTLARLGGDEFALLLENGDADVAETTAERVLEALRLPFPFIGGENGARASIGIVTCSDESADADELLRNADIAMYAAKSAGKGRSQAFHAGLHTTVINRLQLETDMARAVDNHELSVVYQPIVDLSSGSVTGVEALMRWNHPHRGLVMPGEFIPIAETTGLIVPMGRWLLRQACQDVRRLQERTERFDLHLAVNVSARQLDDPRLVDDVSASLAASRLAPGLLTVEITESVFMANPTRSIGVIERLKDLGVKLSIDDFGTGYSSLAYLQRLPVDELKIDRSFVSDESNVAESSTLVETIVRLAQDLGLDTVAEGIETQQQFERLRSTGCHLAQGYLFARPADIRFIHHLVTTIERHPGRWGVGSSQQHTGIEEFIGAVQP
jgi:diguanylate cyclase (GGDEF)-like protein/PAS domain S-box-containing protein